jgi:prefoldin subunit 5
MLEDLSNIIKDKIKKLSAVYKKLNDNKEDLKSKIQKTITNIRNKINEREDELFSTLDSIFSDICPSEKIMKDFEKMPKKIEELLQKKNDIEKKLDDSFILNSYINDCINIENDLKDINEKIALINKYAHNSEIKICFFPEEKDMDIIFNNIKSFGKIYQEEKEVKNFFISEESKEIKNLNNKIDELKKKMDNITRQLNNEKNNNHSLINKLIVPKYVSQYVLDVLYINV